MIKHMHTAAIVMIFSLLLSGCQATLPVYNVKDSQIYAKKVSEDDIAREIIKAGKYLGWEMTRINTNEIQGKLVLRKHEAIVKITFDKSSYNIIRTSTINLKYDEKTNTIHKNYNGWIEKLEHFIDVNLTALEKS